jgi:hypothetical protein
MPPKLNKKEIMKIMNNEMKKKSPIKPYMKNPSGSYVVNRKIGETTKKPSPPKKNNNK